MCRNIKTLFNFDPPATDEEIQKAAEQFVRKVSGFQHPSHVNEPVFAEAIEEVAAVTKKLISTLVTHATPHNRQTEAARAHARALARFGKSA